MTKFRRTPGAGTFAALGALGVVLSFVLTVAFYGGLFVVALLILRAFGVL